jgi:transcriptional regulator with XRE-family HTH domain
MARYSTKKRLGIKIRALRTDNGWTQEKLGELTGLDRTYISDIERGVRNPSVKSLEKFAKAFAIKTSSLLG